MNNLRFRIKVPFSGEDLHLLLQGAWGYQLFISFLNQVQDFTILRISTAYLYESKSISDSTLPSKNEVYWRSSLMYRGFHFIIPFLGWLWALIFKYLCLWDHQTWRSVYLYGQIYLRQKLLLCSIYLPLFPISLYSALIIL